LKVQAIMACTIHGIDVEPFMHESGCLALHIRRECALSTADSC
jgi:hypothetical protein